MFQMKSTSDRPLTLAEICQAIENGSVAADIENDSYVVQRRDLVRLARQQSGSRSVLQARDKTGQQRPLSLAS